MHLRLIYYRIFLLEKYKLVSTHTSSNQNTSYNDIIKKIENIDLNNTTCKEAFDILYNIQQNLKNIQ